MDLYEDFRKYIASIEKELIDFRRDLHSHPEQGWMEIRTSYRIYEELSKLDCQLVYGEDFAERDYKMGLPDQETFDRAYAYATNNGVPKDFADIVKNGSTGLMAVFKNGPGPVVALRFDIDALPLYETTDSNHIPNKEGFTSKNIGSMHACGHDGHISIGLGIARCLDRFKDRLKGTVKIIFQPAEEGVRGARSIVEKGHLDDVDYFLSSHITSDEGYEGYDLIPGSINALATTKWDVEYFGKSTHAAFTPEKGNNAMLGLATTIMNVYAIPRHSQGTTRVNIGFANAGTGRNIIPDHAKFLLETRGSSTEVNKYVEEYAKNIIESSAKMHNLDYKITVAGGTVSFNSDKEIMDMVRGVADQLGLKTSPEDTMEFGGSEDAADMINRVQENGGLGTYMRILTPVKASAHNVCFDFNEEVIAKGVLLYIASTYKLLHQ